MVGMIAGEGEIEDLQRWVSSSSFNNINNAPSSKQPLLSLNHVSFVCESVARSVKFYEDVLGFVLIKRPSSFDFEGAWLFNYGIGIHLLEVEAIDVPTKKGRINPKDNHISFQTPDMGLIMEQLEGMGIEYVTAVVKEGGVEVDQLFFHDPDGYMIEICNCQNLPVLPLSSAAACPLPKALPPAAAAAANSFHGKMDQWKLRCAGQVEANLMEYLVVDMMEISF
ncbi:glyoxylase I 4-like [Diospyros lotus]|uniref:glyoxylase I 4-like n=1 Tax=Diospyros lotus TaxID=55363 RepID=UPI002256C706|nr:glyoxylase I 4-like [Diospyros lotus]